MFKKSLCIGLTSLFALGLVFGRDAASYVTTGAGYVKDSVRDSVPLEFEIERARKMIVDLKPEIEKNMRTIAREEVEVERLERQVARTASKLEKGEYDLARMMNDVKSGETRLTYGGRKYTISQVKLDMTNRLAQASTTKQTLESLDKVLVARKRGLDAARVKLEQILAAKQQLAIEVENLEARRKLNAVAKAAEMTVFDESKLARLQELITDLDTRMNVDERMMNIDTELEYQIPVDIEDDSEDVVAQVAIFLGMGEPDAVTVADAE